MVVRDIMDAEPVTVRDQATVEDAVRLPREHELIGLPVVEDGHRLVGVVTRVDVLEALTREG